ncbi:Protein turtle B [Porites harrisoni]
MLIFASLQLSEALIWQIQPEKPTILVEGVNNTQDRQKLVWTYKKEEVSETIERVTFQRRRDNADPGEDIAISTKEIEFNVFSKFISNYSASIQPTISTLILKNPVTNDDEFIYSIVISVSKNNRPAPGLNDNVQLIVFVPPRITTEPERESEVRVGKNLTLTCNASGDPLPEVTWRKEGLTPRLFNVTGPVLVLVNVTREDVGSYKCTAKNKVGEVSHLAAVNVECTENQCEDHEFGIRITSIPWKQAFNNSNAIEYKDLKSNVTSEIAKIYIQSQNAEKQLYGITIVEFRPGSTIAVVRLRFERNISDPLKPLEDAIKDGLLGRNIKVDRQLLNTTMLPTNPATEEPTTDGDGDPSPNGLSAAEIGGIVGGSVGFVVILIIVSLVIFFRCQPKKAGKSFSEADGYRMNKQPPSSGLGTASPAFVEARMYAPPNAANKKGEPEKRPLPAGGSGGQDGQGGFELWC